MYLLIVISLDIYEDNEFSLSLGSHKNVISVCKVPLTGHPENKYVSSRKEAKSSPGVRYNEQGQLEVQYDASGTVGPPIVQPNKIEYLQQLAFRLGRDSVAGIQKAVEIDCGGRSRLREQWDAIIEAESGIADVTPADRSEQGLESSITNPNTITLQSLAQGLHKIAPDLAQNAGFDFRGDVTTMTELEAAALLQMQIIEESSNNWESRFPVNEHVWEFAAERVETSIRTVNGREVDFVPKRKQFFNMKRFPLCGQSAGTKAAIMKSGPVVEDSPALFHPTTTTTTTEMPLKKERHIKGRRPDFPFGETPFQQAYLSYMMEEELKDSKH